MLSNSSLTSKQWHDTLIWTKLMIQIFLLFLNILTPIFLYTTKVIKIPPLFLPMMTNTLQLILHCLWKHDYFFLSQCFTSFTLLLSVKIGYKCVETLSIRGNQLSVSFLCTQLLWTSKIIWKYFLLRKCAWDIHWPPKK